MKLYSLTLPFLIFALFGYLVHTMDSTAVEGTLQPEAMVSVFEKDYHKVEAFFATGESANHGRYND